MRAVCILSLLCCLTSCSGDPGASFEDVIPDVATEVSPPDAASDDSSDGDNGDLAEDLTQSQDLQEGPDHAFVHKLNADPIVSASQPYVMDEPLIFRSEDKLPSLDVRALSFAGDKLWAGCAEGLYLFDEPAGQFVAVAAGAPVVDIARSVDGSGRLAVVFPHQLALVGVQAVAVEVGIEWEDLTFTAVAVDQDTVYVAAGEAGLFRLVWDGEMASLQEEDTGGGPLSIRDLAFAADGVLWLATEGGAGAWDGQTLDMFDSAGGALPDDDVRSVAAAPQLGGVVAGTATGLALLTGEGGTVLLPGVDSIPAADVLALAVGNRLIVGHAKGATGMEQPFHEGAPFSRFDHWVSQRWLADDRVQAAAMDGEGSVWLGTPGGITRIQWVERTLADKAAHFEQLQDTHFWRMDGFVPSDIFGDDPWQPTEYLHHDHDNDGLWTQMQIGAWCYAYAATGDEIYYEKARKAMDVMFLQIDIPALTFQANGMEKGFVTRSLVREDEGSVYEGKIPQSNWHLQQYEGVSYYWKDDTSSDETTGHFFGYPLFYDLCAKSDEEREEVAAHASELARYIIDGGFKLIDLHGGKTGHGHWHPEQIGSAAFGMDHCLDQAAEAENMIEAVSYCLESWHGGGWLNATEILGHMLAAWHMTGDAEFYEAYELLVDEYGYENLVVPHDETFTVTDPGFMNHSDHELAMLAYHTLIRYEPNEQRRQKWIEGLLFLYQWELGERNPLWAAFVSLLAGAKHAQLEPALQSLREVPFDRREYVIDNSHRQDAETWPDDRFDDAQFDRVFPYDEIKTVWWNTNFRIKVSGGNPNSLSGPMAWLLPYWGLRYSGVIGP